MTKAERENAIISGIKALPKSAYGNYHYIESLKKIFALAALDYALGFHSGHYFADLQLFSVVNLAMRQLDRFPAHNIVDDLFKLN